MNCQRCGAYFIPDTNVSQFCYQCRNTNNGIPFYGNYTNAENCEICQKLIVSQEELYWHLKIHKEKLNTQSDSKESI